MNNKPESAREHQGSITFQKKGKPQQPENLQGYEPLQHPIGLNHPEDLRQIEELRDINL
jgi:hypothetical protein